MGLYKTSVFSIFTFIKDNDLKFCTRSYSSCVYRTMKFKGSNGKVCKMMTSHCRTLYVLCRALQTAHQSPRLVYIWPLEFFRMWPTSPTWRTPRRREGSPDGLWPRAHRCCPLRDSKWTGSLAEVPGKDTELVLKVSDRLLRTTQNKAGTKNTIMTTNQNLTYKPRIKNNQEPRTKK